MIHEMGERFVVFIIRESSSRSISLSMRERNIFSLVRREEKESSMSIYPSLSTTHLPSYLPVCMYGVYYEFSFS